MTLCNLSTHADCKATLVSLHGLPPLIEMLEGESDLVKRYAAMTLCNLSTLAVNQVRFDDDDTVRKHRYLVSITLQPLFIRLQRPISF